MMVGHRSRRPISSERRPHKPNRALEGNDRGVFACSLKRRANSRAPPKGRRSRGRGRMPTVANQDKFLLRLGCRVRKLRRKNGHSMLVEGSPKSDWTICLEELPGAM
jgi:hypothetical protein